MISLEITIAGRQGRKKIKILYNIFELFPVIIITVRGASWCFRISTELRNLGVSIADLQVREATISHTYYRHCN